MNVVRPHLDDRCPARVLLEDRRLDRQRRVDLLVRADPLGVRVEDLALGWQRLDALAVGLLVLRHARVGELDREVRHGPRRFERHRLELLAVQRLLLARCDLDRAVAVLALAALDMRLGTVRVRLRRLRGPDHALLDQQRVVVQIELRLDLVVDRHEPVGVHAHTVLRHPPKCEVLAGSQRSEVRELLTAECFLSALEHARPDVDQVRDIAQGVLLELVGPVGHGRVVDERVLGPHTGHLLGRAVLGEVPARQRCGVVDRLAVRVVERARLDVAPLGQREELLRGQEVHDAALAVGLPDLALEFRELQRQHDEVELRVDR